MIPTLVENSRLQLEMSEWPNFQRAMVSLRQPQIIQDTAVAHQVFAPDADSLELVLDATTRLFYVVKELPQGMQLGFTIPTREIMDTGHSSPFFELDLSLLKPCPGGSRSPKVQVFEGADGGSYCVEQLVQFSTWPHDPEGPPSDEP